jgi:hypothetical protein
MKKAVIKDGKVINIVKLEAKAKWTPPEGCTLVNADGANLGDTYKDGKFTTPKKGKKERPKSLKEELEDIKTRLAKLEKDK